MKVVSLRQLCSRGGVFRDGDWVETPHITTSGNRLIQTGNVGVGVYREQGYRFISDESFAILHCTEVLPNDVLICRLADPVGRACLAPELDDRMLTSVDVCIARPTPGTVDNRYLVYYLSSSRYLGEIEAIQRGGTRQRISREQLGSVRIPLPQLPDQRAIADYLDTETARIDAVIAKKRRMSELLDERYWQWVSSSIASLSAPTVLLRRVIHKITDGPFGSSLTSAHYEDAGARVVRLGNIGFAEFKDSDRAFISLDHYSDLTRHRVAAGDVLIAGLGDSRNHVGRACVAPDLGQALVKADCYCATLDRGRATPDFVALFLSSPIGAIQVAIAARGTTRSRINLDIAKEIRIPLATVETQRDIVAQARQRRVVIAQFKDRLERQIDLLVEHRRALITAAVSGEFAVPGVAA